MWGCLIFFFAAVAGGGVWLVICFFCFFCFPDAWSVALFSFSTTSVDALGEQSTSVFGEKRRCNKIADAPGLGPASGDRAAEQWQQSV